MRETGSLAGTPAGIGNSPPEMKVADSPEIAVRFGSASVRTTPAVSIARMVACDRRQALQDARGVQAVVGDQRRAVCGERIAVVEIHDRGAVIHAGAEIDAHLLDDVAPHFRDSDLQHHLVAAANDDRVDDLFGAADQSRGDLAGLLGLDRARYRAGQEHAVADAFDLDSRHRLPERGAHAVEVALDRDVVGSDLLAVGIEEHDVGLADRGADDIGALRRANDGVGDLGIGDQHILHVARQVDDHGFADAERRKRVLTPGRWPTSSPDLYRTRPRRRRNSGSERQRGDGRQQQGAGRHGSHR